MEKLILMMHFAPAIGIVLMLIVNLYSKVLYGKAKFKSLLLSGISLLGLIIGSTLHQAMVNSFDPCIFYTISMLVSACYAFASKFVLRHSFKNIAIDCKK